MRKYGMKDRVIKRNTKDKKISKKQETINRRNSKTSARVEHPNKPGLQRMPL